MSNIFAQLIGFIGLSLVVISFQNNQRKKILLFLILSSLFWFTHFMLLGALTGAVMNIIGTARGAVFYHREKDWAKHSFWLYTFLALFTLGAVLTWQNIYSILPMAGMYFGTISIWMKKPTHIRWIMLLSSPCWFAYNMVSGSIPGMITEVLVFTSILVGIIRFDVLKKPEKSVA